MEVLTPLANSRLLIFFKSTFSNIFLRNTISVKQFAYPDQAQQNSVGPDLGLKCLQRLSVDGTRR